MRTADRGSFPCSSTVTQSWGVRKPGAGETTLNIGGVVSTRQVKLVQGLGDSLPAASRALTNMVWTPSPTTSTSTNRPLSEALALDQLLAPSTAYVEDTMLSSTPVTSTAMVVVFTAPINGGGIRNVKLHTRGGSTSRVHTKNVEFTTTFPAMSSPATRGSEWATHNTGGNKLKHL